MVGNAFRHGGMGNDRTICRVQETWNEDLSERFKYSFSSLFQIDLCHVVFSARLMGILLVMGLAGPRGAIIIDLTVSDPCLVS